MPSKHDFPYSISAEEAARNPELNESRQRRRLDAVHSSDNAGATSLRKTTPRLAHPIAPDFDADNSTLVLPVAEVDYYDGNPRFDLGDDYADLKASIRAEGGLISKLCVTRRPGSVRYMVEAGGNRRLRALKELAEEDSRFRQEIFIYRAWRGESTVLLHHLAENMQRADMTLWEQANGVMRLKRQLERERGEIFSLRGFGKLLGELGLSVGKSALSIYAFVVERLAPLGAAAAQRLNFKSIEEFQRRFNQLTQLAALFGMGEETLYADVLSPTLELAGRECAETGDFKPKAILAQCEAALAQRLDTSATTLQQWLGVIRINSKATREDLLAPCAADAEELADKTSASTLQHSSPVAARSIANPGDTAPGMAACEDKGLPGEAPIVLQSRAQARHAAVGIVSRQEERLKQAVATFAHEVGAADYVRWHDACPAGFYVEIPDLYYEPGVSRVRDLQREQLDEAALDAIVLPLDLRCHEGAGNPLLYRGWWLLMQLSGLIADASPCDLDARLLERLPPDASWRRAMSLGYDEIDRVLNEITGERPDLAFAFDWLTAPEHRAGQSLRTLLEALREVRRGL